MYYAIWDKEQKGFCRATGYFLQHKLRDPILIFDNKKEAMSYAAIRYGKKTYSEAKRKNLCVVRGFHTE